MSKKTAFSFGSRPEKGKVLRVYKSTLIYPPVVIEVSGHRLSKRHREGRGRSANPPRLESLSETYLDLTMRGRLAHVQGRCWDFTKMDTHRVWVGPSLVQVNRWVFVCGPQYHVIPGGRLRMTKCSRSLIHGPQSRLKCSLRIGNDLWCSLWTSHKLDIWGMSISHPFNCHPNRLSGGVCLSEVLLYLRWSVVQYFPARLGVVEWNPNDPGGH